MLSTINIFSLEQHFSIEHGVIRHSKRMPLLKLQISDPIPLMSFFVNRNGYLSLPHVTIKKGLKQLEKGLLRGNGNFE